MKLENFLVKVDPISGQIIIKLIDFGIACEYDPAAPPTRKCGTLVTVAPEIIKDDQYGPSVDLWSLGVILYELLTNSLPFYS